MCGERVPLRLYTIGKVNCVWFFGVITLMDHAMMVIERVLEKLMSAFNR